MRILGENVWGNLTAGSNPAPSAVRTRIVRVLIIGFCLLVFLDYIFYILCRARMFTLAVFIGIYSYALMGLGLVGQLKWPAILAVTTVMVVYRVAPCTP